MREKKLSLLVTFEATTMAMKMEKVAKENNLEGRLIPLPREISAGCGFSFKTEIPLRAATEELMLKSGITASGIYEIML